MKQDTPLSQEQKTLHDQWENYRGTIVMVVGDRIFSTKRAANVNKLVEKIEKEYHRRPLITYIPKEDTLVLFF